MMSEVPHHSNLLLNYFILYFIPFIYRRCHKISIHIIMHYLLKSVYIFLALLARIRKLAFAVKRQVC